MICRAITVVCSLRHRDVRSAHRLLKARIPVLICGDWMDECVHMGIGSDQDMSVVLVAGLF